MELPHCSAMWRQHSRSAAVIVTPGSTQAMAGVIAHRKAIVNSANARYRVTLISVPLFADTIRTKVLLPTAILEHVPRVFSDPRHTFSSTVVTMPSLCPVYDTRNITLVRARPRRRNLKIDL